MKPHPRDRILSKIVPALRSRQTVSQFEAQWQHPLFATTYIAGVSYEERSRPYRAEFNDTALENEIIQASLAELVATVELDWMDPLLSLPVEYNYYLDVDVPEFLEAKIFYCAAPHDNAIIVSSMALTLLQSSTSLKFVRWPFDKQRYATACLVRAACADVKSVGLLGDRLVVIVNPYLLDYDPVLIGRIEPQDRDRTVSLVRTGITTFAYGMLEKSYDGWKSIEMTSLY